MTGWRVSWSPCSRIAPGWKESQTRIYSPICLTVRMSRLGSLPCVLRYHTYWFRRDSQEKRIWRPICHKTHSPSVHKTRWHGVLHHHLKHIEKVGLPFLTMYHVSIKGLQWLSSCVNQKEHHSDPYWHESNHQKTPKVPNIPIKVIFVIFEHV